MLKELESLLGQLPLLTLAALPPSHDIRQLIRQIILITSNCAERQRTPLAISQKIVQALFKTPSSLGREIYVALLDELCHSYEDVAKEAITWLIYAEDEVRSSRLTTNLTKASSSANSISLLPCRFCGVGS